MKQVAMVSYNLNNYAYTLGSENTIKDVFFIVIHVVKSGDTLYSIGRQYQADYLDIAEENQLALDVPLVIGQTIVITDANVTPKLRTIQVNGYAYPTIKEEVLEQTLPYLTYLSIFSYHVLPDGSLKGIPDEAFIEKALHQRVMPIMVITNMDDNAGFNSQLTSDILNNAGVQQNLISQVIETMQAKGYKGVDVDFEYIFPDNTEAYNQFLQKLTDAVHREGFLISTALAPKTSASQTGTLYEAHDYAFHGQTVDKSIIMTYEWGHTYGPPMPVAPIPPVRKVLEFAVQEMPSHKILMGVPNYGYDWKLPYAPGTPADAVGIVEAVDLARENDRSILYNDLLLAPFFNYNDNEQGEHIVWFEDARSIQAKLLLVDEFNLAGPSYWTINQFFPQNWLVLSSMYDIEKML